jgi:DNA helicase-2/ATP-dependent DNA helicase PcrA
MQLNEEQMLAVQHPLDEPACLIAGAGSGKTRVLTERVRWIIKQGIKPPRICAITFTNKAAGELIDRLGLTEDTPDELLPRVSTIHSLALLQIRRDPEGFGLAKKVTPLDDYDQRQMMKTLIDRLKTDEEIKAKIVIKKISFHRARGIGFRSEYTDEVHDRAKNIHSGYHALTPVERSLWEQFEIEKQKNSVVDFDDMLHLVVRRLREDAEWLAEIQTQYDHVLMDEAQDTNPVQWEFVTSLLPPGNLNLYIVGDMSQSIYGFNGAVPDLLRQYSEGYKGVVPKLYRIARNHRSGQKIVDIANAIQYRMTHTIPLKMESWRGINGETGETQFMRGWQANDVAFTIAAEIARDAGHKRNPILFRDNCILVRSNRQIPGVEGELVRRRIPYIVRGGRGLLQTEEVRDVLAYLRLVANRKDFQAMSRAVAAPKCGVGPASLEKLRQAAEKATEGDLIAASQNEPKLANLVRIVEHVDQFKTDPVTALEKVILLTNYKSYIHDKYKREKSKIQSKLDNLVRFAALVDNLFTERPTLTLEDLVFQLTLERPKDDDEQGAVVISTIHAAKGLEWRRVYVANLIEGSLPHMFSMGSEEEIEEERRLFYVACTRARDVLVLCFPEQEQRGPNTADLAPSRFLKEIGIKV